MLIGRAHPLYAIYHSKESKIRLGDLARHGQPNWWRSELLQLIAIRCYRDGRYGSGVRYQSGGSSRDTIIWRRWRWYIFKPGQWRRVGRILRTTCTCRFSGLCPILRALHHHQPAGVRPTDRFASGFYEALCRVLSGTLWAWFPSKANAVQGKRTSSKSKWIEPRLPRLDHPQISKWLIEFIFFNCIYKSITVASL